MSFIAKLLGKTEGLRILVQDKSTLGRAEVAKAIKAINKQLDLHYFPAYGIKAQVYATCKDPDATMVLDDGTSDDYLGYHDLDSAGRPIGVVLVRLAASLGDAWTTVFSHEVLEMVGDPQANLLVAGPIPGGSRNVMHWREMCDAVQNYWYQIDGVEVSDFVLPGYFVPGEGGSYLHPGLKAFSIAAGGYVGYVDPRDSQNHTVAADKRGEERHAIRQKFKSGRGANHRNPINYFG